ncbi:MAG: TrkA C-terminal domain-containing protein [Clostridia bacterium]|jgi:K+/H+ antiporter YhaU regulatory subunit KhtT|nr:TrkA C-terminal domain-containing protein [Clostridia bacterium]
MQLRVDTGESRYEQIAIDIARRIARGEFHVEQKLSGRSLLAGNYNVSPETIRRSIALLQNIGVVQSITGSGIIVKSSELAREYLKEYNERQEIMNRRNNIITLMNQRRALDIQLEKELSSFLEFSFQKTSILQQIEEVSIPPQSWIVDQTIAAADLRHHTGTTIMSIHRNGKEIYSPPANMELKAHDVLIIVGTSPSREKFKELIKEKTSD